MRVTKEKTGELLRGLLIASARDLPTAHIGGMLDVATHRGGAAVSHVTMVLDVERRQALELGAGVVSLDEAPLR